MSTEMIKNELLSTVSGTIEFLKKDLESFNKQSQNVISDYENELVGGTREVSKLPTGYDIDNIINIIISQYIIPSDMNVMDITEVHISNNIDSLTNINSGNLTASQKQELDKMKSTLIKLILDMLLEYQYMAMSNNNFNINEMINQNSQNPEEIINTTKMMLLKSNPELIGNLAKTGTMELLARQIGEQLNIDIVPQFEQEYQYMRLTKILLNNRQELLIKGDVQELTSILGETYKENYLLNEANLSMQKIKTMNPEQLSKLNLTYEQQLLLSQNMGIEIPNIEKVKEEKQVAEVKKVEEELNLNDVQYIEKDGVQYATFEDKDGNMTFAEIVGNLTPQERIERIKNGISDLPKSGVLTADDISKEIKSDMITNDEFKSIDEVLPSDMNEELAHGIDILKQNNINTGMKVDTKTGIIIDNNKNMYDTEISDNGKVEINQLTTNTGSNNNIVTNNVETGKKEMYTEEKIINLLKEYGVISGPDEYYSFSPEYREKMRIEYNITRDGDPGYNNEQTLENTSGLQHVLKKDKPTGYVSALIVTFMTGALGGMIAMILMNLAK
ncbi:MAG: hypothetical protein IJO32_04845 [Bacilli bacterium]|nr:hypothetical protein [Bacilli bacterium]